MNAGARSSGRYRLPDDQDRPEPTEVLVGKIITTKPRFGPHVRLTLTAHETPDPASTARPSDTWGSGTAEPASAPEVRVADGAAPPVGGPPRRYAYVLGGAAMIMAIAGAAGFFVGAAASRPTPAESVAPPAARPVPAASVPSPSADPPSRHRSIKVVRQPKARPEQPVAPTPSRPRLLSVGEGLERLESAVERGEDTDEIRDDVALDLDNRIEELQDDIEDGERIDVAARVGVLREKVATRLQESGLTKARADELTAIMARIKV